MISDLYEFWYIEGNKLLNNFSTKVGDNEQRHGTENKLPPVTKNCGSNYFGSKNHYERLKATAGTHICDR